MTTFLHVLSTRRPKARLYHNIKVLSQLSGVHVLHMHITVMPSLPTSDSCAAGSPSANTAGVLVTAAAATAAILAPGCEMVLEKFLKAHTITIAGMLYACRLMSIAADSTLLVDLARARKSLGTKKNPRFRVDNCDISWACMYACGSVVWVHCSYFFVMQNTENTICVVPKSCRRDRESSVVDIFNDVQPVNPRLRRVVMLEKIKEMSRGGDVLGRNTH